MTRLRRSEEGATAAEYTLAVALIALVSLAAWQVVGAKVEQQTDCTADVIATGSGACAIAAAPSATPSSFDAPTSEPPAALTTPPTPPSTEPQGWQPEPLEDCRRINVACHARNAARRVRNAAHAARNALVTATRATVNAGQWAWQHRDYAEMALGFVPVVGTALDVIESGAVLWKVANGQASWTDLTLAAVAFVPGGDILKHADKLLPLVKNADSLAGGAQHANHAAQSAANVGHNVGNNADQTPLVAGAGRRRNGSQEITRDFPSFNSAMEDARRSSGLEGPTQPYRGTTGPQEGRVVGRQSLDGKRGWRIDYDPKDPSKGYHINWWDWSQGNRGRGGVTGANHIDGMTPEEYARRVSQLNH